MRTEQWMNVKKNYQQLIYYVCIPMLLVCMLLPTTHAMAYEIKENQSIYDDANLLTEKEIKKLEKSASKVEKALDMSIVILLVDTTGADTGKHYAENFYDDAYDVYQAIKKDTAILLVNMDPNDRNVIIQGYGNCEFYLNNTRIEYMLDDIVPALKEKEYYNAMEAFINETEYYMNEDEGVSHEYKPGQEIGESYGGSSPIYKQLSTGKQLFFNIFVQLGIALVIGGISVAIMALRSSGTMTTNSRTYLDSNNSKLVVRRDDYIRTSVTKVKKPDPPANSSSGPRSSGGGGVSSGGHSHSGGGRSF